MDPCKLNNNSLSQLSITSHDRSNKTAQQSITCTHQCVLIAKSPSIRAAGVTHGILEGRGRRIHFLDLGRHSQGVHFNGQFQGHFAACCVSSVPVQRTLTLVNGDYQEGGQRLWRGRLIIDSVWTHSNYYYYFYYWHTLIFLLGRYLVSSFNPQSYTGVIYLISHGWGGGQAGGRVSKQAEKTFRTLQELLRA